MTQEDLAEVAGLDRSYVGGVERGERNVSLLNILRLANALRVNPDRLLKNLAPMNAEDRTRLGSERWREPTKTLINHVADTRASYRLRKLKRSDRARTRVRPRNDQR